MTKFVTDDIYVNVNGVNISSHVDTVDVKESHAQVNVTGMGASAEQMLLKKAKTDTIDMDCFQEYGAALNDVLEPLRGSNTPFSVIVRATSNTAISSTNPQYTGMMLLPEYEPIVATGVGAAGKVKVSFVNGDSIGIVKAESGTGPS